MQIFNKKITILLGVIVVLLALSVGGVFVFQKSQISKRAAPITAPKTSEIKGETADWKIYSSEKYGVGFKYPQNNSYSEDSKNPIVYFFQPPSNQYDPSMFFSVQKEPVTLLFQGAFGIALRTVAMNIAALDNSEDVIINSILWRKEVWFLQAGLKAISFNTKYKDNYYTIALGIDGPYTEKETTLNAILSTFKFLK